MSNCHPETDDVRQDWDKTRVELVNLQKKLRILNQFSGKILHEPARDALLRLLAEAAQALTSSRSAAVGYSGGSGCLDDWAFWPQDSAPAWQPEEAERWLGRLGESSLLRPDAKEVPGDLLVVPITGDDGKPVGLLAVRGQPEAGFTPEDEILLGQLASLAGVRLQAGLMAENRRERDLFERLLRLAPVGIAVLEGPDHRYTVANDAYLEIAHGMGEIIGRTVGEVWGKHYVEFFDDRLDQIYQSGESFSGQEKRLLQDRGNGPEERFFNFDLTPLANSSNEVEGILILVSETTHEVKMRRRLHAQQALFETIVKSAPVGISVISGEGMRFVLANPAYQAMTPDPALDPLGRTLQEVWPLEEGFQVKGLLRHVLKNGESVQTERHKRHYPNGEVRYFSLSAGPVRWGEQPAVLAVLSETTRLMQAEQALMAYTRQLEQKNADLKDFAFIASHDLQQPLRKVKSFGELLKKTALERLTPEERDYLERMQGAVERMSDMLEDLLVYSRVSTRGDLNQAVDLNKTMSEVLSILDLAVQQSEGLVQVDPLPMVLGDPAQMRQLFQNLIDNSLKFHAKGQVPEVRVWSKVVSPEMVEVYVQDNGIGFEPQYLERIFQPFHRLHGNNKYPGSGMGLAIARKVVERHNGSITAESAPGQGTRVVVRLSRFTDKLQ